MNRAIKFRAWFENEMWDVWRIEHQNNELSAVSMRNSKGANVYWFSSRMEPIELEQYTGLKDKNGVEIYEGDVVREQILGGTSTFPEFSLATVIYKAPSFIMDRGDNWLTDRKSGEVIGNIHEEKQK